MTYTKGKWIYKVAFNGDCGIGVVGETGIFIECFADIRHPKENAREEAEANAKTICDLLNKLQGIE